MHYPRARLFMVEGGLLLSFLFIAHAAHAQSAGGSSWELTPTSTASTSDPCIEKPLYCNVPTPTIIQPTENESFRSDNDVIIKGLSWNDTKVHVYIDGLHSGTAVLRTDPSNVGNFWFRPAIPLAVGTHSLTVIAWNLSEWERSPQSPTIHFTVLEKAQPSLPVPKPAVTGTPVSQPEQPDDTELTIESSSTPSTTSANSLLDWFFNRPNTSTAASGTATSTATLNRTAVSTVLFIIFSVIAFIALRMLRRGNRGSSDGKETPGPGPNDTPPLV